MKTLIGITVFFLTWIGKTNQKPIRLNFPQVDWTIEIPEDFTIMDSSTTELVNQKGVKLMEESNNIKIDGSDTKTLISATKGNVNLFNASVTTLNQKTLSEYEINIRNIKTVLYNTFSKLPKVTIDTATSIATIDSLTFDKFQTTVKADKVNLNMVVLTKFYKNYQFGITYIYVDPITQNEIETILKTSKFKK